MMPKTSYLALVFAALSLTACSDVRDSVGLGRVQPDEFAVVDRAPLVVPPDFTLKPPTPGASRPQEINMNDRARMALFGTESAGANSTVNFARQEGGQSGVEQALLANAGADKAQSDIRTTIDNEAVDEVSSNRRFIDELLFWRDGATTNAAVVDAAAEKKRLNESKAEGKSPTESATPVIERSKSTSIGL